ncbi:MAG: AtpZ/AtpI family protein [Rickettsiales bacterium]|nr:AtpZ/AtpI family protein [Rickettsiales bacterium]
MSKPDNSLENLQQKLDKARHLESGEEGDDPNVANESLGMAVRMGIDLVAGTAVGFFLGLMLDRWLETSPFLVIIGFFLGVAAGFRNMLRNVQKLP